MQEKLRGVLEAIGCEPRFLEHMTFDIAGHGFRNARRPLGPAVIVEVIRPEALQRHMWAPDAVTACELGAQERQVVKTLDERNALEPLVLKGLDDAFRHSNGPVFSHGSDAGFDIPFSQ